MKPKLKRADPASRTFCKMPMPPPGSMPGLQAIHCQNVSMAQFAEWLSGRTQALTLPVTDSTSLDGTWDLTVTYTPQAPVEAEPSAGLTLFEAVEKQLGLKLSTQKRTTPVFVIDHLEQKPTGN